MCRRPELEVKAVAESGGIKDACYAVSACRITPHMCLFVLRLPVPLVLAEREREREREKREREERERERERERESETRSEECLAHRCALFTALALFAGTITELFFAVSGACGLMLYMCPSADAMRFAAGADISVCQQVAWLHTIDTTCPVRTMCLYSVVCYTRADIVRCG